MEASDDPPPIGILMAVHRPNPEFLRKQVESIRAQTHAAWTLTMVLDGLHPELEPLLADWSAADPRIRSITVPGHAGCCRTFGHALATAKGTNGFIALADQDDIWEPSKLEKLVTVFRLHPDTVMAFCDSSVIDENDRPVSPSLTHAERRILSFGTASLMARNCISGHAQLFRASLLDHAVPFPGGLCESGLNHDHWLALAASLAGPIRHLEEPLVRHRLHGANQIGPRLGARGGAKGLATWRAQNRRLRDAMRSRHELLGRVPGYPASGFGRPLLLRLAIAALLDSNPRAAAIHLRACCAIGSHSEDHPPCH